MNLKEAIKQYLQESYDENLYDLDEASEAMEIYFQEYVPDVINMFLREDD